MLAGESGRCRDLPKATHLFQSTPAIAGGRIRLQPGMSSFNAMFQSTPAIAGGRIAIDAIARVLQAVSIHARHCWRANPPLGGLQAEPAGCFNPRPPLLAGESPWCAMAATHWILFQSTPAIAGGRIRRDRVGHRCVNHVSIHARHCWRANPLAAILMLAF